MYINSSGIKVIKYTRPDFYIESGEEKLMPNFIENTFGQIEDRILELEELIENKIFPNYKTYVDELSSLPDWVLYGGLDSDFIIDKPSFENNVTKNKCENINKHLYLLDIKNIINATSQRVLIIRETLILFYESLSEIEKINDIDDVENGIVCITGLATTKVFLNLHNIFISLYSIFDLVTKIAYEIENIKTNFSKYQKLSSLKILFGDKKN